ncbi:substrate binding domain-containing protein [Massilia polaris]|uniref:substrate binding domain-containing protein n=1 Tax=Massilia polaris TaxID=2728846 RepID=UPI003F8AF1FE
MEFVLSDARADLLGDGIDLALRGGKILEPDLVARKIGTSRFVLVASPAYLAARGLPTTLEDLESHDCITAPSQAGRSSWSLDSPTGPVVVNVEGRFSANIAQVMLNASLANLGVALVPTMMSAPHLHTGRLQEVLPAYGRDGLCIHLVLVYVRRIYLPRAISAFIDFMIVKVQAHGLG